MCNALFGTSCNQQCLSSRFLWTAKITLTYSIYTITSLHNNSTLKLIRVNYSQFSSGTLHFPTLPPGCPNPVFRGLNLPFQTPPCLCSGVTGWAGASSRLGSELLLLWQAAGRRLGQKASGTSSGHLRTRSKEIRIGLAQGSSTGRTEIPCSKTLRTW